MRLRSRRSDLLADRIGNGAVDFMGAATPLRWVLSARDDSAGPDGSEDATGEEAGSGAEADGRDDGQWHPDGAEQGQYNAGAGAESAQSVQAAPQAIANSGDGAEDKKTDAEATGDQGATAGGSGSDQVEWINPSVDSALVPGGQLLAQWRTATPLESPAFSLCANGQCGEPSHPTVMHADDGTSSAKLSLPTMPDTQGMYLQMSPGGNYADTTSPAFNVNLAAAPTATSETDKADPSSSATMTRLKSTIPTTPTNPSALASISNLSLPPFPTFTGQNLTPSMQVQSLSSQPSRPNAVAIAVPLAICALILLAALGFCARNKFYRSPGKDEEKDWESIVKAKAAAASTAGSVVCGPTASAGVTVIPRQEADGGGMREFAAVPILPFAAAGMRGERSSRDERDGGRQWASEEPYAGSRRDRYDGSRRYERESRRGSRDSMEYSRSSGSGSGSRYLTPIHERETFTRLPRRESGRERGNDKYDFDRRDSRHDKDRYYSTSRRSSSSIGGMSECSCRDYPHTHAHEHGRGHSRTRDYDLDYEYDEKRPSWSRMYSGGSAKSGRSIYNPHPPTSLGPHGHPMSLSPRMSQSASHSSRSNSTFGSPLEEYRASRPLPRVRGSSSGYWESGPHQTGVLEREDSRDSSHAGWGSKAPVEGRRRDGHGLGGQQGRSGGMSEMDGLYESLRLAIGSPAPR